MIEPNDFSQNPAPHQQSAPRARWVGPTLAGSPAGLGPNRRPALIVALAWFGPLWPACPPALQHERLTYFSFL